MSAAANPPGLCVALLAGGLALIACANERDPNDGQACATPGQCNAVQQGGSGGTPVDSDAPITTGGSGGAGAAPAGGTGGMQGSGGSSTTAHSDASTSPTNDAAVLTDAAVGSIDASTELHPSFVGCRSPREPGCAECKAGENDYRRSHSDADWYNSSGVEAVCEPVCPPCALCTFHDERIARDFELRQECLPCVETGVDPCFDVETCACWCRQRDVLRAACPTLVP